MSEVFKFCNSYNVLLHGKYGLDKVLLKITIIRKENLMRGVVFLVTMALFSITGCTHYAGITQGSDKDSYYVITNTIVFGIISPDILYCKGKSAGKLACSSATDVDVDYNDNTDSF